MLAHDCCGARIDLKKGGVAAIRIRARDNGELLVLLRPREIAVLAGSERG
ncbi:MAG: hypothetical protein ACR2ND_15845 [Solirubrobacteraceae bacterium]